LFEGSAVLALLVDTTLARGQIAFPPSVESVYIDVPISITYRCQNLRSRQNVDVVGSMAGPTETNCPMATVKVCARQQLSDRKATHAAAVLHAGQTHFPHLGLHPIAIIMEAVE
jgi:hypothetical protein